MSSSKSSQDDLGESWVEICSGFQGGPSSQTSLIGTPASVNHQYAVDDYLRLLKEAQESNQSSARDSLAGSRRDSPRSSPKSPPNSPIESTLNLEWQAFYANSDTREGPDYNDWSSRPDQLPPKTWSFRPPKRDLLSLRYARVGNNSIFSRKGLYTLFLTNILSLLLGAGVGLWLSKHGGLFVPAVKIR